MRLIVQVLPLSEGPANSLAAYSRIPITPRKPNRFTLPVRPEQTFEQIWTFVEERYKRNYLTPAQAANFMIKKIQDGYDCDLDLSDTVGAIFEGEKDQEKIMIQVIQASIDRDISVPVTSNLRPANAYKRLLEIQQSGGNKRRRIEEQRYGAPIEDLHPDRPVHSRERDVVARNFEVSNEGSLENHDRHRGSGSGSGSGSSVIVVEDSQPGAESGGNPSFEEPPKSESPEPGGQSVQQISESSGHYQSSPLLGASDTIPTSAPITFIKPSLPASKLRAHQSTAVYKSTPHSAQAAPITKHAEREDRHDVGGDEDVDDAVDIDQSSQDVANQLWPKFGEPRLPSNPYSSDASTPEYLETTTSPTFRILNAQRVDVYEDIESPDEEASIMNRRTRRLKTYSRHPRTPRTRQTKAHPTYTPQSPPTSAQKSNTIAPSPTNGERAEEGLIRPSPQDQAHPVVTPTSKIVENARSGSPMHATKLLHIMRERRRSRGENPDLGQSPKTTSSEAVENNVTSNGNSPSSKSVKDSSTLKKPLKRSYKMPSPKHPLNPQNTEKQTPIEDNSNTQYPESAKSTISRKTKSPSAGKQREYDEKRNAKEKEKELADKRKTEAILAEHFSQKEANEAERKSSERDLRLRESEERRKLREETSSGSQDNAQVSVMKQTPASKKTRLRSSVGPDTNSTKKGRATRSRKLTETAATKTRETPSRKAREESNEKRRQTQASTSVKAPPSANSRPESNAATTSPLMDSDEKQARLAKIEELRKKVDQRRAQEAEGKAQETIQTFRATITPPTMNETIAQLNRRKNAKESSVIVLVPSKQPSNERNIVTPVKEASFALSDQASSVQGSVRRSVSFSTELESSEKKGQTRLSNIQKATSPTGILKRPARKTGGQASSTKANKTHNDAPEIASTERFHPVIQRAEVPLPDFEKSSPEAARNASRAKSSPQEKSDPQSQLPNAHSEHPLRRGKRKLSSPTHDAKNTVPPNRQRSETPSQLGSSQLRKTITPNITPAMRQTLLGFPRDKGKEKSIRPSPPKPAPSEEAIAISSDSDESMYSSDESESQPNELKPGPSMTAKEEKAQEVKRKASAETDRAGEAHISPTSKEGVEKKFKRTASTDHAQHGDREASPFETLGAQNTKERLLAIEKPTSPVNVDQLHPSCSTIGQDHPVISAQKKDGREEVLFNQTSVPNRNNILEHEQSSEERQISEEVQAAQMRHETEQRQPSKERSESSRPDESGSDDLDEIDTPKPVELAEAMQETKVPEKASPEADQSDSESESDSNWMKDSPESSPSSPPTTRAPARYISHTPSEGSTSSNDESPEMSQSSEQAQDAQQTTTSVQEPPNEDVEMEDDGSALPSSPPELHVEEKDPSPTPSTSSDSSDSSNSSQGSSQSLPRASGLTKSSSSPAVQSQAPLSSAAGRAASSAIPTKSRAVLSKFPTLKQQLEQVRAAPAKQGPPKPINPGTMRLNGVNGALDSDSDDSSDDSSSSSEDEDEGKAKPGSLFSKKLPRFMS